MSSFPNHEPGASNARFILENNGIAIKPFPKDDCGRWTNCTMIRLNPDAKTAKEIPFNEQSQYWMSADEVLATREKLKLEEPLINIKAVRIR